MSTTCLTPWLARLCLLSATAAFFSKMRVDYGTGVLLEQMSLLEKPTSVLDLGCGYGPLGLFAAAWWPKIRVDMVDVNERALALARKNARANGLGVNIFSSDGYAQVQDRYDLIVTNPPIRAGKKVVSAFLSEAVKHLNPGGKLLVVIQKKQGEPSAKKLMTKTFGNCQILKRDKGYYILQSEAANVH
jgi:16S rRNA (guanine1207-N2)-methyltransferase